MPQLISTPEDWFRNQMRDLYLICPAQESKFSKKKYMAEQKKLHAWFADHLPHTPLSIVGPSEYSGWIEGGPRYLAADFDSAGLAAFTAAWGEEKFWRIEIWSFADWRKRVETVELLTSPVGNLQKIRWWDTPRGILMLNANTKGNFLGGLSVDASEGLLSLHDGWWRLQQLFPEFSELKADTFPCGLYWPAENKNCPSFMIIEYVFGGGWDSDNYAKDVQKIRSLKNTIGIPDDMPLEISIGDF